MYCVLDSGTKGHKALYIIYNNSLSYFQYLYISHNIVLFVPFTISRTGWFVFTKWCLPLLLLVLPAAGAGEEADKYRIPPNALSMHTWLGKASKKNETQWDSLVFVSLSYTHVTSLQQLLKWRGKYHYHACKMAVTASYSAGAWDTLVWVGFTAAYTYCGFIV